MMNKDAKIVSDGYNKIGPVYNEWAKTVRVAERDKYIRKVKERCPRGGKVLDVGCGNGSFITSHFAEDFQVAGVDISDYQISEAQKNVPKGEFMCGDVRDCRFEPATFDAIMSFYCFNHIERNDYPGLLARFHEWLKVDGYLVASFGVNDEKEWIGEWLGARTFFSSHSREATLTLINAAGFRIESEVVETEIEDGEDASFLWIIARKQASNKSAQAIP